MPTFFDPHPGFAGAAVSIPREVKAVADGLNGQRMSLRKAVNKIKAVASGKVQVVSKYKYISLIITDRPYTTHLFRVIQYR